MGQTKIKMSRLCMMAALFLPVLFLYAQKDKEFNKVGSKEWQKNWASFSPGKWIMNTEVTNAGYKLFLQDLKDAGKEEEYEFFYPDTLGWNRGTMMLEPYVVYYFSHHSFSNYPVVNITHEAAYDFCMWLNEAYSKLKEKPFGNVFFMLPTREEWMLAARGGKNDGRPYPWKGEKLRNSKNQKLANYRDEGNNGDNTLSSGMNEKAWITAPVNSFFANEIGLYCMSGNVAEMVAEKGIAVGGSYMDAGQNIRIDSKREFIGTWADIGFRVIMVVQ